jgi:hypothetical protein
MNGAQHTPGPWRTGDMFKTVFGPPNGMPSPETIATVRKKADAVLISAAPKLLSCLHRLVTFLDPGIDDATYFEMAEAAIELGINEDDFKRILVKEARTAIAGAVQS